MKRFICIFLLIISSGYCFAQGLSATDIKLLRSMEDSMAVHAKQMIFADDASARFYADSIFIRSLVKALRVPYSFNYRFDSVKTVSKLYPPDSNFRIFTWELQKDESYYRQFGVIQVRTADGALKMFPLFDQSDYAINPVDSVRQPGNWIGALYYQLIQKEYNGKKFYTLLGLDDNDLSSTKKWMEVLYFNDEGKPVFGGLFFEYKAEDIKPDQPAYRFCLEFKKDARARMVFDPELDLIIFDHLISEENDTRKKYTLIPDGDYEGFRWQNGKWVHIEKVFEEQQLKDGQAPMPKPFLDKDGNPIDDKE